MTWSLFDEQYDSTKLSSPSRNEKIDVLTRKKRLFGEKKAQQWKRLLLKFFYLSKEKGIFAALLMCKVIDFFVPSLSLNKRKMKKIIELFVPLFDISVDVIKNRSDPNQSSHLLFFYIFAYAKKINNQLVPVYQTTKNPTK